MAAIPRAVSWVGLHPQSMVSWLLLVPSTAEVFPLRLQDGCPAVVLGKSVWLGEVWFYGGLDTILPSKIYQPCDERLFDGVESHSSEFKNMEREGFNFPPLQCAQNSWVR